MTDFNLQHITDSAQRVKVQSSDQVLKDSAKSFTDRSHELKYSYNFNWLSRPIIQYPQDIVAIQEIICTTSPDIIIETGIAHGGSLIFLASMLCLLDIMEGVDPKISKRKVIGIDIDIRSHNLNALNNHPLRFKIDLIEGSSTDIVTVEKVSSKLIREKKTMVILDSNHTHQHVLDELNLYSGFVSNNCYLIVFDTIIDSLPEQACADRSWNSSNNPLTAVKEWISNKNEFEIDNQIDNKLMISMAPSGYLKRIK